jgi:hypothetical protein
LADIDASPPPAENFGDTWGIGLWKIEKWRGLLWETVKNASAMGGGVGGLFGPDIRSDRSRRKSQLQAWGKHENRKLRSKAKMAKGALISPARTLNEENTATSEKGFDWI